MSILKHKDYFAAIDMGTNSFHLIIVKIEADGSFKIVDRERIVIRLGSNSKDDFQKISLEEEEHALEILSGFKKLASEYDAQIRAVATSAVREAKNNKKFIETIFDKTGIAVEIIEGKHEANLIFQGAKKALNLSDKKVLCVDIGGGSTEIILGQNNKIIFAESIKIGAVRMTKKFFPDFVLTDSAINKCQDFVEEQISSNKNILFDNDFEIGVGTSGTIQSAASMILNRISDGKNKSLNGYSFNKAQLKYITYEILNAKSVHERQKIKFIDKKRADILPAGLIILNKVFELFNMEQITISEYALREGVILEMIDKEKNQL